MPVVIGAMVLVSGDTYEVKDECKALGGVWVKGMGWAFPEQKRSEVEAALGKQSVTNAPSQEQKASTGDGAAGSSETEKNVEVRPSVNADATLLVSTHKRAIIVTGETLKVKEQLRQLKGGWNKGLQGWVFQVYNKRQ